MDTSDLSKETDDAILLEAEKFHHDLTLKFGLQSYECENEQEFIEKSVELIGEFKSADPWEIEDIFFGEKQNLPKLHKTLNKILDNINKVKKIPFEKRHFEF